MCLGRAPKSPLPWIWIFNISQLIKFITTRKASIWGEIWPWHFTGLWGSLRAGWEKVKCTKSKVEAEVFGSRQTEILFKEADLQWVNSVNPPLTVEDVTPRVRSLKEQTTPLSLFLSCGFLTSFKRHPNDSANRLQMCHAGYPQNPGSAAECLTNLTQRTDADERESLVTRYLWLKSDTNPTCREHVWTSPQNQLFRKVRKTLTSQTFKMHFMG